MTTLKNTSDKFRVVFDTNIYLAAFLRSGLCEELMDRATAGDFQVFSSPELLEELEHKLHQKSKALIEKQKEFLNLIHQVVNIVYPTERITATLRDAQDHKVLECALAAKVQLIVSLDHDLLDLKEWRSITIAHPRTFTWIIPK